MVAYAFLLITCLAALLFYVGIGAQSRILIVYLGWCIVIAGLSYTGFFKITDSFPPRILLVIIPATIFVFFSYQKLSKIKLNNTYLLAIHALRFPVELILYQLYLNGLVPDSMTFLGWNFDILSGISALALLGAIAMKHSIPSGLFKAWNIVGLLLLAIIVITAIISVPSPLQLLSRDQPNVAILLFPYTLLPGLVVPLVILSHLLLLKQSFQ